MDELTNAEAALLGLLSEKPMYPYQIEQEVKYRDMRSWTELSMFSIYKLLNKLEKQEFAERTNQISPENRLQNLYTISKSGKLALQKKLRDILSSHEHVRWRFDIGTYNSDLLSAPEVSKALNTYREELQNKIKFYKDLLGFLKDAHCPVHRFAIATRPMFLLKAEIKWVDAYLAEREQIAVNE